MGSHMYSKNDQSVHAALVMGPDAPAACVPAGLAQQADISLNALIERCTSDAACAAACPEIKQDLEKLKFLLNNGGWVLKKAGKHTQEIRISAGVVASCLRMYLYGVESAASLPRNIHALATGDGGYEERNAIAGWRKQFAEAAPWGM